MISIQIKGSELIPMAEECVKWIEDIRRNNDNLYEENFMREYNLSCEKWYNRLIGKKPLEREEVHSKLIELLSGSLQGYRFYPDNSADKTYFFARSLLKIREPEKTYTISMETYQNMKTIFKYSHLK